MKLQNLFGREDKKPADSQPLLTLGKWTKEGLEMNSSARSAEIIEERGIKDHIKLMELEFGKITEMGLRVMKLHIRQLLKGGWLEEKPDRYVMTQKAKDRLKMLRSNRLYPGGPPAEVI